MARKKKIKETRIPLLSEEQMEKIKEGGKTNRKWKKDRKAFLTSYKRYKKILESVKSARKSIEIYNEKEMDSPLTRDSIDPGINEFHKELHKESIGLLRALAKMIEP